MVGQVLKRAISYCATDVVLPFGAARLANNKPITVLNQTIVLVSCGQVHSALLCESGKVYTFGGNQSGQLGLGYAGEDVEKPTLVYDLRTEKVTQVACGGYHTLFLTSKFEVYACGRNDHGQLGQGDKVYLSKPTLVSGLSNIIQLAVGGLHSAALTGAGLVFVWGDNSKGQLGLGHNQGQDKPAQLQVTQGTVAHITCGVYYTAIITGRGALLMCGCNGGGKLGSKCGDSSTALRPVALASPVAAVACGLNHTVALTVDGSLWAWGANSVSQRGVGDAKPSPSPQQILGVEGLNVAHITAGDNHSAIITESGELYTWGEGDQGKLCLKDKVNRHLPTRVATLANYTVHHVACGWLHTLVLLSPKDEFQIKRELTVVTERERALNERSEAVKKREQILDDARQLFTDKESIVYQREQAVSFKEQELAERERSIYEKEITFVKREQTLHLKEKGILISEEAVTERENRILERERIVRNKEFDMEKHVESKLTSRLSQKETELDRREKSLNEREHDLISKEENLKEREKNTSALERSLSFKEKLLKERENEMTDVEPTLREFYMSKTKRASVSIQLQKGCFVDSTCSWYGPTSDIIDHTKDAHPSRFLEGPNQEFIHTDFSNEMIATVISAYDEVFVLSRVFSTDTDRFQVVMQCVGSATRAQDYKYKFELLSGDEENLMSFQKCIRSDAEEFKYVVTTLDCVAVGIDSLTSFIENNTLKCRFTIMVRK